MHRSRWPLHPRPIKEECILSWLTRIANCYELTLDELLKNDLGFHEKPDDLNISTPDWLLILLSKRTGVSKQDIYAMTLSSFVPFLLDDMEIENSDFEFYVHDYSLLIPWNKRKKLFPKKPWKPWFSRSWNISKACPICVTNEPTGATFLTWSLPIMLSCPIHKCYLRQCHTYQGRFGSWKNENESFDEPSSAIHVMDQRSWSAITTGQVLLPCRTVHGSIWFRLLRALIDELHVAQSSLKPFYAEKITNIWTSNGFESRAGRKVWCPYEELSFESQCQTLIAAATAIEQIENGSIKPHGKLAILFFQESCETIDLESHSLQNAQEPESSWHKMLIAINDLIEISKYNPQEAMNFRSALLFGKSDPVSIQKVNNIFRDAGIPY